MLPFVSTIEKEKPYEAAKWLKIPVLADVAELSVLFDQLGPVQLARLGSPLLRQEVLLSKASFLSYVTQWIDLLKRSESPSSGMLRATLPCAMSQGLDCFWLQEITDGRVLVKIRRPVIQLQVFSFFYSSEEKTFHPMVFGKDSVFWGIQFSFPQIWMEDGEAKKVDGTFFNGKLFSMMRQWQREATAVPAFLIEGKRIRTPIRLGKSCFSWIHQHPDLEKLGLRIADGV